MSTAGLIVISLFAGGLFVVIVAGLATLIYLHLQLKNTVTAAVAGFAAATAAINDSISGARTSFTGIRQDVKTALADHGNQVADVLAKHQKAFEETVGKVNGAALEAACVRSIRAAAQIAEAAKLFQSIIVAAEGGMDAPLESRTPMAAEEYAPSDTIYAAQSPTARMDAMSEAADAIEGVSVYAEA